MNLTPAGIVDSTWALAALETLKKCWPGLKHLFADGAYDRRTLMDKAATLDFVVRVVRRHENQVGFAVLPRRWVVERTFVWRDYERRPDASRDHGLYLNGRAATAQSRPSLSFQTDS